MMRLYKIVLVAGFFLLPMMFVACGNKSNINILGVFDESDKVKSKEFYEGLLEQFCQEYYDDLYHDFWGTRSYVNGSLKVDSVRLCGEREVEVFGTHDFEGRLGHVYKGRKYSANICESKKNKNEYIVTFEKESKKIISRRSYTESRTKTIHYEN